MMNKEKKYAIAKLWIAGAILLALCLVTDLYAQEPAVVAPVEEVAAETTDAIAEQANGINTVWMLLAAMLVFFMQPGFALVEAGFTRTKNTANILMKNFVDFMFGSLLFWIIGFGLMFGAGGFVGMPTFFDSSFYDSGALPNEGFLIFQTVFCATAATIVSGAMAERTKFSMYLVYTL
ncbi:MAG: ammonium transporter, partial [Bacteroides sp.]